MLRHFPLIIMGNKHRVVSKHIISPLDYKHLKALSNQNYYSIILPNNNIKYKLYKTMHKENLVLEH